jgi:hypothetical protein
MKHSVCISTLFNCAPHYHTFPMRYSDILWNCTRHFSCIILYMLSYVLINYCFSYNKHICLHFDRAFTFIVGKLKRAAIYKVRKIWKWPGMCELCIYIVITYYVLRWILPKSNYPLFQHHIKHLTAILIVTTSTHTKKTYLKF